MDVKQVFERNAARLNALYAGQDQLPRYAALADDFRAHFGREPEMFVSAPGRTEVVGNHTDHQNGRVLAAAVNLDTVAAVAANGRDEVKLYSAGYDEPFVVELTDLTVRDSEKNTTFSLIRGVAARLKELGYAIGGFDAQVTSTVFKGSGLSSSAAFEVMLVAAFDALFNNWSIDPKLNARISQFAENVYFGKPSGLLDQSASAVGGLVAMDFAPAIAEVEAINYDFGKKGYAVCVVSVGGEHGNLTDAYASIPLEMKQVAKLMGAELLEKITPEELEAALPKLKNRVSDRAILRAFHFVDETRRAAHAAQALKDDDLQAFFADVIGSGESSWKLLQNLHVEASDNQEMPLALEMSRRMLAGRGAWRIHGGGFAGTILAFVPNDLVEKYSEAMDSVFGEHATTVLSIRPEGVVCIK
ncbi:MAG: galactokinase family protein [Eubacteriales bacterium]|nr:galactokinase family protein [Eubacteriales bacterium]